MPNSGRLCLPLCPVSLLLISLLCLPLLWRKTDDAQGPDVVATQHWIDFASLYVDIPCILKTTNITSP